MLGKNCMKEYGASLIFESLKRPTKLSFFRHPMGV